jgi:ATP-dependent DNA helicase RecG
MTSATSSTSLGSLDQHVKGLHGVGPTRAALLSKLEVHTVEDLLLYRPRRYENRQKLLKIAELELQQPAITHGKIVALGTKWFRQHTKSIFEIILDDGTARLHCRWWNLPYMEKYFSAGDEVLVFGKPLGLKPRTIDHPETEVLEGGEENFIHLNRITPVYSLTEGLGQRWLRALIWRTLDVFGEKISDPWPAELLPSLTGVQRPARAVAIRQIHFPETHEQIEPARQRLALDEFVLLQRQIRARRKNFELKAQGLPCSGDNRWIKPFLKKLGFKLTPSQTKVLREIRLDMSGQHPMRRLLQGDVGSGKTLVAACGALMALESGFHAALMAPTEILAEQHFATFSQWFAPLGVTVALRTGNRKPSGASQLKSGELESQKRGGVGGFSPTITIGTHALIEAGFQPDKLGLVIIDEQHKFGVAQREQLLRKGCYPHLLVMTATPIPRTLGLTLYGDLDVSVLDELPPGRGRIHTFIRGKAQLPKVWEFLQNKITEGRQVYIVYPHIDGNEPAGIKAVLSEIEILQQILAPARVGVIHGRLRSHEKEGVMTAFRARELHVLLATSIIEVGVDVSNATVMLIQNAEQFGLAQLHQLRGRIGRGAHDSYCILVTEARNKVAQERLRVLEETTDGFRISEADLRLRGPGELLGQDQSGMLKLRFGDLVTDESLITQARLIAAK